MSTAILAATAEPETESEIQSRNLFGFIESLQIHLENLGLAPSSVDAVISRGLTKLLHGASRESSVAIPMELGLTHF